MSAAELSKVEESVKSFNSRADLIKCSWGAIQPSELLALRAFNAANLPADRVAKLSERSVSVAHSNAVVAFLLLGKGSTGLTPTEFTVWLSQLLATHSASVYRLKGIVSFASSPDDVYILQGVHSDFTLGKLPGAPTSNKYAVFHLSANANIPAQARKVVVYRKRSTAK